MLHLTSMVDHREAGISEVVGFVFILALLMGGLSLFFIYGVPVQGREDEIKEMDGVRGWFVDYKTGLDQIWLSSLVNATEPKDLVLVASTTGQTVLVKTLDPGTTRTSGFLRRYLPVLSPIRSSGSLTIRDTEKLEITVVRDGSSLSPVVYRAPALAYRSQNNYWLQQEYIYQLGAVQLRQWDLKGGAQASNTSMIASPPFTINYTSTGEPIARMELTLVQFNGTSFGPSSGIGSSSPIRVESRLDGSPHYEDPAGDMNWTAYDAVTLTYRSADSQMAEAWNRTFYFTARRGGLPDDWCRFETTGDAVSMRVQSPDPAVSSRVKLEVLAVNYTVGMQNVPTMIE